MKRWIYSAKRTHLATAIQELKSSVEGLAGQKGVGTVTHDIDNHRIVIEWNDKSPSLIYTEAQLKDPNVSMSINSDVNKMVQKKEK